MGAKIITGYTGERHITPLDDAAVYRSIFGQDSYITNEGNHCKATMPSINEFTIADGQISLQGVQARITQETLPIDTCASGKARIDLVVARYTHDNTSKIDNVELMVLKGIEVDASNTPTPPEYEEGRIDDGATTVDMPLYEIDMEGATVTFKQLAPTIDASFFSVLIPDGAASHNAIYRGKYLGDTITDEQWEEISSGRFHDLFIGDYWTINDNNWRIADFDYWLYTGDSNVVNKHHVVIVPDKELYKAKMNDTNIVTGAYVGSKMYTTYLNTAKTTINNIFGSSHILSHRSYLQNAVANAGYESGGAWLDSTVELMSEEMAYGNRFYTNIMHGTSSASNAKVENSQLNLFRHDHSALIGRDVNGNRSIWWLRGVASTTAFCVVHSYGLASASGASNSYGVRPAFAIC